MISFSCHKNIFLFTGSKFLLMLHFGHYLHGRCFYYLSTFYLHAWKLVAIETLAVCAFSKKGACTERNALFFQCNHEHTCLICFSTVLIKCIGLPWPEKNLMEEALQKGRRYITATLLSSVNVQCTILAQFLKFD